MGCKRARLSEHALDDYPRVSTAAKPKGASVEVAWQILLSKWWISMQTDRERSKVIQ